MKKNNFVRNIIMIFVVLFLIYIVAVIIHAINIAFKYNKYKENTLDLPVRVPVASQGITSGEYITDSKIRIIEVSKSELPNDFISNVHEIVGKCLESGYVVEEKSYFYDYMLVECSNNN